MESRHDRYALGAAALLAMGVLVEFYRMFPGQTWPGYAPVLSRAVSASFMLAWTTTAVAVVFRRRHRLFASLAWTLAFLSPMFMVAHAAITRVGGSHLGLLYVPLAAALGFALKGTLDRGERFLLPTNNPGGRLPEPDGAYRLMPRPRG
jgi:hypothetical protein